MNMKRNFKIITLLLFFMTIMTNAQVGLMSDNPNKDAVLDLNNTNGTNIKGLLLPKVALNATTSASPMTAHVQGMRVYNTSEAGTGTTQVFPGMYFNDGTKWINVSADWEITGNGATDVTVNFIGNKNAVDFPIRTNNVERMRVTSSGKVLVNTTTVPSGGTNSKMIVNNGTTKGAIQIKDGTEADKRILISDENGLASWKDPAIEILFIDTSNTGISLPYTLIGGSSWKYTNSKIVLPPGKWLVTANILLTKDSWTGPNESWWVRSTFSDSSTILTISPDIISRSVLISGALPPNSYFNMMSGTLTINNTSGMNKTYYYIGGYIDSLNATGSLYNFGGVFGENGFMVQKIN